MSFVPRRTEVPDFMALTLAEAKEHLELDHDDDDAYVTALIAVATDHLDGVDGILSMDLLGGSWEWYYKATGETCVKLPNTPVREIDGATIGSVAHGTATLEQRMDGDYVVFSEPQHGTITFAYAAGYEDAASIPAALKHAMKLHIGSMYEHRETEVVGTTATRLPQYESLISPYRRRRVG